MLVLPLRGDNYEVKERPWHGLPRASLLPVLEKIKYPFPVFPPSSLQDFKGNTEVLRIEMFLKP